MNTILNNDSSVWTIGWAATAAGIFGFFGLVFIILFFILGQPFGTLNDIFIGLTAIVSAWIAWMFYSGHRAEAPILSQFALALALLGALVVVTGSVLVITGVTGWFLAGLYMAAGYALIGLWLLILTVSASHAHLWPAGLVVMGLVSGGIMAFGLAAIPGLLSGMESQQSAYWMVIYVGQAGALGWLLFYPAWCLLLGRQFLLNIPI